MAGALAYVVWFLCVCSLGNVKPVESSHFMGGIIQWRPVDPAAFDGVIQISHRIAWRRDSSQGLTCTQAAIDAQILMPYSGRLTCQSGCSGTIGDFSYYCTDFSITDNWIAGERTYTYNFTESSFEAVFARIAWIYLIIGGGLWELRVWGNLTYRRDTGLINSSPVVNLPPLICLQHGCNHTIKIPVEDADGDYIRCRWANSSLGECGGVCSALLGQVDLNKNAMDIIGMSTPPLQCEIQYTGSNLTTGDYAVALQIEDFSSPADITPMSSVPVQFVIRIQAYPSSPCNSKPEFVGATPSDGACFGVPFNTSWRATISARVSNTSTATSISEIVTASPHGMRKSDLVQFFYLEEWQVSVTWTPLESQIGPNIFCYAALDSRRLQSAQRCITLFVGVEPLMILPGSMSPRGKTFSKQNIIEWSVKFNKQFTRPTKNTYIRIFGEEEEVFSINVRTSATVTYPNDTLGRTLTFSINNCQLQLPVNQTLYVLLDEGVAVSTDFCHTQSLPTTDTTLWAFMIVENTDTQENHTVLNDNAKIKEGNNSIIITTACTIVAFILGIICGLIADHCICALLKRKAEQQETASLQIENISKGAHYEMDANDEASAVYDEVTPHYYKTEISNMQMELSENAAYGRI